MSVAASSDAPHGKAFESRNSRPWAPEFFACAFWQKNETAEHQWRDTVQGFAPVSQARSFRMESMHVCTAGRVQGSGRGHDVACDASTGLLVVCDARLNDQAALSGKLSIDPSGPAGPAELILRSYQRWNAQLFDHLVGDFAFALVDARRREVLLGRDIYGLRPLYFSMQEDSLAVSSSATPLAQLPWMSKGLNHHRLLAHFGLLDDGREQSFYAGVEKLPGEHALLIAPGVRRQWMYGKVARTRPSISLETAAVELGECFESAVRDQLRGRRRPASMLSGGLDSSTIVVVARDELASQSRLPLLTYSGVFPQLAAAHPKADESRWIEAVVATGGIESIRVPMEGVRPWDAAALDLDEPNGHPNSYLMTEIFAAAAAGGADLLFSGHDGDSSIGYGLGRFRDLFLSFRWMELQRQLRAYVAMNPDRRSISKAFHILVTRETAPQWAFEAWRRLRRIRPAHQPPSCVAADFASAGNFHERSRAIARDLMSGGRARYQLNNSYLEYGSELLARIARHHDLSCAMPFLDQRVVYLAMSLPERVKWDMGVNRLVMREAMRNRLPDAVRMRCGKQDISANVRLAMHARELPLIREQLQDLRALLEPVLVPAEVFALLQRFEDDPMELGMNEFYLMFQALNLVRWRAIHAV